MNFLDGVTDVATWGKNITLLGTDTDKGTVILLPTIVALIPLGNVAGMAC